VVAAAAASKNFTRVVFFLGIAFHGGEIYGTPVLRSLCPLA